MKIIKDIEEMGIGRETIPTRNSFIKSFLAGVKPTKATFCQEERNEESTTGSKSSLEEELKSGEKK